MTARHVTAASQSARSLPSRSGAAHRDVIRSGVAEHSPRAAAPFSIVVSFSGFSIAQQESPVQLNPYLTFNGNCEAAFTFYQKVLGGKIDAMMTHEAAPPAMQGPPGWQKKIMHARLVIGERVLMGSDAPPDYYEPMKGFSVTLGIDTPAEAERVFNALAEKGTVRMPLEKTFWAERFGMLTDQFGTPWMINCENRT
jgi:PhnB protein